MDWTESAAVAAKLRRRWDSGELLRAYAEKREWEPYSVPIAGPRPGEIAGELDAVRAWAARWESACRPGKPVRLERREIGGRLVGRNELPGRAWVESYAAVWVLLGVRAEVEDFDRLVGQSTDIRIAEWAREQPLKALTVREEWPKLLATAAWIEESRGQGLYLRQIEVSGVDTKFVERHRTILAALLERVLPSERIDTQASVSEFAQRYGFASKPEYVRFRFLDPSSSRRSYSELSLRADELAASPPEATRVFIVENEITYLSFPKVNDAVVIFGAGFGLRRLRNQEWLSTREVNYWGDIDTHGFAILNQLRSSFESVRSILMDRETLLANRAHWSTEPKQHRGALSHLSDNEAVLYAELLANAHGPALRLEQERVPFSMLPSFLG
ncbi:MAG TPA: Wadjet anti-phage system protein JetD domain-containing protein [Aeromicrobium sp.]|nr:Wadjet anti-phage system protein JetD domain-containing protein [Aeromicrobium sp.]